MGSGPIQLNLGCGNKIWDGWINVDHPGGNYSGKKPDVEADLKALPFEDNYADHIAAIHVVEHFYVWEAVDALKEWYRVLKPGGSIDVESPCMDKILMLLIEVAKNRVTEMRSTWWGLYGDPRYKDPKMCHRWCYTVAWMKSLMEEAGFTDVVYTEPLFHKKNRDMRLTGKKPDAIKSGS